MIITGAPVEKLAFEEVDYWDDLKQLMDDSKKNVFSTIHICWAAQAGLYYHYNIEKTVLDHKIFGIYPHKLLHKDYYHPLTRDLTTGFSCALPSFSDLFRVDPKGGGAGDSGGIRTGRSAYDCYEE